MTEVTCPLLKLLLSVTAAGCPLTVFSCSFVCQVTDDLSNMPIKLSIVVAEYFVLLCSPGLCHASKCCASTQRLHHLLLIAPGGGD
jgi:hypothetical protein